jgi:post-segregation antitoxin (ccd killing protein)
VDRHKRRVHLTLDEDLVAQARLVTDNLSALVASLLEDYLARQQPQRRIPEAAAVRETVSTWNRFAEQHGSFTDEHSAL